MYRILFLIFFSLSLTIQANSNPNYIQKNELKKIEKIYGKQASTRVDIWNKLIKKYSNKKTLLKLKYVNNYFNQFTHMKDIKLWKKAEYWASYKEFLSVGAGDNEDFAIAKYFTLINMGVPKEKLKISFIRVSNKNSSRNHIVLLYYHKKSSVPVVLDNTTPKLLLLSKRVDVKILANVSHDRVMKRINTKI